MERVRRNIMIPASLDRELDTMSEVLGDSRSSLVSRALSYYFDMLDLDIARDRARRLEAGKTKPLSPAELRKALGL
jgi:predicted DNA-binding protein